MSYFLSDGVSSVAWSPDYTPNLGVSKMQDSHRTPTGSRFVYKWADILSQKHSISYVTSADTFLFNNWWLNNTVLMYTPEYDALDISTVALFGSKLPGANYEKPYNDLYRIMILIEEVP